MVNNLRIAHFDEFHLKFYIVKIIHQQHLLIATISPKLLPIFSIK